jgi:hypothetical protein
MEELSPRTSISLTVQTVQPKLGWLQRALSEKGIASKIATNHHDGPSLRIQRGDLEKAVQILATVDHIADSHQMFSGFAVGTFVFVRGGREPPLEVACTKREFAWLCRNNSDGAETDAVYQTVETKYLTALNGGRGGLVIASVEDASVEIAVENWGFPLTVTPDWPPSTSGILIEDRSQLKEFILKALSLSFTRECHICPTEWTK